MPKVKFVLTGEIEVPDSIPIPSSSSYPLDGILLLRGNKEGIYISRGMEEGVGGRNLGDPLESDIKERPNPKWKRGWKSIPDERFEKWYAVYPRKVAKMVAEKAFRALMKSGASVDDLMLATSLYSDECTMRRTEPQFIMHPSTFLRNERWRDYHRPSSKTHPEGPKISPEEIESIKAKHTAGEYDEELVRKLESKYGVKII